MALTMTSTTNGSRGWMPAFPKPDPKVIPGVFVAPADCAEIDGPHYPTPAERLADLIVHVIGLAFAVIGGGVAVALAVNHGVIGLSAAIGIYALGFIAMLSFSAAYNFAHPRWQPFLFRLDHAGIFLMIAASYTPFTTQLLHGAWSWGMTAAVWTLAIIGIIIKLCLPRLGETVSMVFYLIMGWLVVLAIKPLVEQVPLVPLVLLAAGGIVYSIGAVLFVMKRCKFRRAIWHGHVVAGAITHYAAIMVGVVLAGG
jgi:hemolysin III